VEGYEKKIYTERQTKINLKERKSKRGFLKREKKGSQRESERERENVFWKERDRKKKER
jgi:hypothetical protein